MLTYSPRLPIQWDSGFFVADFVAVHSCEGSGGFAPLFPLTSNASELSKRGCKSALHPCNLPLVTQSEFQQVEVFTKRELTAWVEALNWSAEIENALDLLRRRSRAS
jgi:hypothetical protein